jgi:hypothetical protein
MEWDRGFRESWKAVTIFTDWYREITISIVSIPWGRWKHNKHANANASHHCCQPTTLNFTILATEQSDPYSVQFVTWIVVYMRWFVMFRRGAQIFESCLNIYLRAIFCTQPRSKTCTYISFIDLNCTSIFIIVHGKHDIFTQCIVMNGWNVEVVRSAVITRLCF